MTRSLRLSVAGVALLAVVTAFTVGCGYHLVGTSSFLPEELETLYVKAFENRTDWADMDQRVTEAVVQEWVRRSRFRVLDDRDAAELVLEGVVTSVGVSPVQFDERGRATEYQLRLTASVRLYDDRGEEPVLMWENRSFSRETSYQVDASAVDYFDRQTEAIEELAQEYGRALVISILEGF